MTPYNQSLHSDRQNRGRFRRGYWILPALVAMMTFLSCTSVPTLQSGLSSKTLLGNVSLDARTYGDLIYTGAVYPLKGDMSKPLYIYERHVQNRNGVYYSTSFTREGDQAVLVQVAKHDSRYRLQKYTEYQFQLGEVSTVTMSGDSVEFHVTAGRSEKRTSEIVSLPVVVGPSLYGFINQNWEKLIKGETIGFRFPVISRMETVGFELKKAASPDDQIRIQMTASSMIIALFVDPIYFTYSRNRRLISLEGRVPTKVKKGNAWADLDAYVAYKNATATFR